MTQTAIIECPNCKGLMLTPANKKTKTCPYCGTRIDIAKAKRMAQAETAMQASEMLRKLKAERQSNPTTTRRGNPQS